jgi:hypothetical protein
MSYTRKISSIYILVLAAVSTAMTIGFAGCNKNGVPDNSAQNQTAPADQLQADQTQSQNPEADANLAPVAAASASNSQAATSRTQAPPPASARTTSSRTSAYNDQPPPNYSNDDSGYNNSGDYGDDYDNDTSYGQPVLYAQEPPPPLP